VVGPERKEINNGVVKKETLFHCISFLWSRDGVVGIVARLDDQR
jgi:hypothetical protein